MILFLKDENEIELDNANKIINFVYSSPGIRYNELQRVTGLSNGVLSYHLNLLEKMGRILIDRKEKNRTTRFFPIDTEKEDSEIIAFLRNKTSKKILKILLENKRISFNEIVDRIDKVPSTVSWHLKRMEECNIIVTNKKLHVYKFNNEEKVKELLAKYSVNIIEKSADVLIDTMDEL